MHGQRPLAGGDPQRTASTRGWATALPKRPTTTTSAGGKPHSYYVTTSSVVDDLSEFSGADHVPLLARHTVLDVGLQPAADHRLPRTQHRRRVPNHTFIPKLTPTWVTLTPRRQRHPTGRQLGNDSLIWPR